MKETTNRLHTLLVIYYVLLGGFVWFLVNVQKLPDS